MHLTKKRIAMMLTVMIGFGCLEWQISEQAHFSVNAKTLQAYHLD